jgi:hypothetical protein
LEFLNKTDFLYKAPIYVVICIGKSQSRCLALVRHDKLNPLPTAWGTAMKRPQFSLRSMLLIVALAAAIIGWRTAVNQTQAEDRIGQRRSLELTVVQLQRQIESSKAKLNRPDDGWTHELAKSEIEYDQTQLVRIKRQIDELSK